MNTASSSCTHIPKPFFGASVFSGSASEQETFSAGLCLWHVGGQDKNNLPASHGTSLVQALSPGTYVLCYLCVRVVVCVCVVCMRFEQGIGGCGGLLCACMCRLLRALRTKHTGWSAAMLYLARCLALQIVCFFISSRLGCNLSSFIS